MRRRALRMEACRASTCLAAVADDGKIEDGGAGPAGAPGGSPGGTATLTGDAPLPCCAGAGSADKKETAPTLALPPPLSAPPLLPLLIGSGGGSCCAYVGAVCAEVIRGYAEESPQLPPLLPLPPPSLRLGAISSTSPVRPSVVRGAAKPAPFRDSGKESATPPGKSGGFPR